MLIIKILASELKKQKIVTPEYPNGVKPDRVVNTGYGMIKVEYAGWTNMYNPDELIEIVAEMEE